MAQDSFIASCLTTFNVSSTERYDHYGYYDLILVLFKVQIANQGEVRRLMEQAGAFKSFDSLDRANLAVDLANWSAHRKERKYLCKKQRSLLPFAPLTSLSTIIPAAASTDEAFNVSLRKQTLVNCCVLPPFLHKTAGRQVCLETTF